MNRPRWRCSCDRQRVPRRRARVGDLCGFPDTAERVPAGSHKTGRCAGVRECPAELQHRSRSACGRLSAEERAASGEAGEKPGAFLRQPIHFCPQCGQFWAIKTALFCEGEKWIGADFRKKPRSCRCCRHYFGAFCF